MERYTSLSYKWPVNLDIDNKKRYYPTILDITIDIKNDDIYVITTYGDRLDLLAYQYYSDETLWWIIAAANPTLRKDSFFLEPGIQLRIPRNYQNIVSQYYEYNISR